MTPVEEKPSVSVETQVEEAPKAEEALPSMEEKAVKKPRAKRSPSTKKPVKKPANKEEA